MLFIFLYKIPLGVLYTYSLGCWRTLSNRNVVRYLEFSSVLIWICLIKCRISNSNLILILLAIKRVMNCINVYSRYWTSWKLYYHSLPLFLKFSILFLVCDIRIWPAFLSLLKLWWSHNNLKLTRSLSQVPKKKSKNALLVYCKELEHHIMYSICTWMNVGSSYRL